MKNKLIIIGSGTHAVSCIDVIKLENKYSIFGIVDKKNNQSKIFENYKYLGTDYNLIKIRKKIKNAFISVGFIKDYTYRVKIFKTLKKFKFFIPKIISPISYVSKTSTLGEGSIVFHNVLINSNVSIGYNCIINSKSLIEHDVIVGNNTHISTGCIINGSVRIGHKTFIGSGTIISNNITIGDNCFIKMGSRITKNISNNTKI